MTIIITGCSKGIGLELVKIWAEDHFVYGISRDSSKLEELKSSLRYPENFNFLAWDITKINSEIVDNWIHHDKIDLLVNNAGTLINKPFAETTYADFEAVYRVNVFGAAQLIRHLLPFLTTDDHVLNISSMGGVNGTAKFPGLAAYSSSKGALGILTELLAEEFKDNGPRCNALALGAVQTEMLAEAFPDYKAPVSASQMANYIADFSLNGHHLYNGKVLPISQSTP